MVLKFALSDIETTRSTWPETRKEDIPARHQSVPRAAPSPGITGTPHGGRTVSPVSGQGVFGEVTGLGGPAGRGVSSGLYGQDTGTRGCEGTPHGRPAVFVPSLLGCRPLTFQTRVFPVNTAHLCASPFPPLSSR